MPSAMRALVVLVLLTACGSPEPSPRPVHRFAAQRILSNRLDLLLMVDGTSDMRVPQERLIAALPRLIELVSTDGFAADFRPMSLNVAVVTADMGTGGASVPTCANPQLGDDGVFRSAGDPAWAGCTAGYPSFLQYDPDSGASVDSFATAVGCVARVGTRGCGFEQPLESILKALSPAEPTSSTADDFEAPVFFGGSRGHGDGENYGFRSHDSVLVIVHLSTDDDCSARDSALFDPSSPTYAGTELSLRCLRHPEALHPIARYVDGLIQLQRHTPRLLYVPIVGIPQDLEPGEERFDALVSLDPAVRDARMQPRVDPTRPSSVLPSCGGPEVEAYPPVRTVTLARDLAERGASVIVGSICADSYELIMERIVERVGQVVGTQCLSRRVPRAPDGSADCTAVVRRLASEGCDDIPGAVTAPTDEPSSVRCEIRQLSPSAEDRAAGRAPAGEGWFVDDYSVAALQCSHDGVVLGTVRGAGSHLPWGLELECHPPVGRACDPACALDGLICEPVDEVCAIACRHDVGCERYGEGFTCDQRTLESIDPQRFDGDSTPRGICVPSLP